MGRYALQRALDTLPDCFRDAVVLDLAIEKLLAEMTERRREQFGRGGGAPPLFHRSLNKAVVVAAVGAVEAYFENLAEEARGLGIPPVPDNGWYPIKGARGALQTPSPANLRRLFWSLFHFDLMESWKISVTTSAADVGGTGTWRKDHATTLDREEAASFLEAMVKVRHLFAHMDETQSRRAVGMALASAQGKLTVQSHHAFNAVSAALQLAIQSTVALAEHLGATALRPRWQQAWNNITSEGVGLAYFLTYTPVEKDILSNWSGRYPESQIPDVELLDDASIPSLSGSE